LPRFRVLRVTFVVFNTRYQVYTLPGNPVEPWLSLLGSRLVYWLG
jgi:hypothetical protein